MACSCPMLWVVFVIHDILVFMSGTFGKLRPNDTSVNRTVGLGVE